MKAGQSPFFPGAAVIALLLVFQGAVPATAQSVLQAQKTPCAAVTFLEGTPVRVVSSSVKRPLTVGEKLYAGSVLQTDPASRVELTLTGGGIVRMPAETAVELATEDIEGAGQPGLRFQVMLQKGEIWINLSNQTDGNELQVLTSNAMLSGPRSVFRAMIFPEGAAEIKDYEGQVTATGPFEILKENGRYTLRSLAGDKDDTPEPWRHTIPPYRKIIVQSSGAATLPFRFAAKSDLTAWVRWNQARDETAKK